MKHAKNIDYSEAKKLVTRGLNCLGAYLAFFSRSCHLHGS